MSTVMEAIVAELEAGLAGDWSVVPWSGPVDGVETPTVLIALDQVEPDPQGFGARRYAGRLLAVSPDELGNADDEREDVLAALERSAGVTWSAARAATLDGRYPAWEIDFAVPLQFPDLAQSA